VDVVKDEILARLGNAFEPDETTVVDRRTPRMQSRAVHSRPSRGRLDHPSSTGAARKRRSQPFWKQKSRVHEPRPEGSQLADIASQLYNQYLIGTGKRGKCKVTNQGQTTAFNADTEVGDLPSSDSEDLAGDTGVGHQYHAEVESVDSIGTCGSEFSGYPDSAPRNSKPWYTISHTDVGVSHLHGTRPWRR